MKFLTDVGACYGGSNTVLGPCSYSDGIATQRELFLGDCFQSREFCNAALQVTGDCEPTLASGCGKG